MMLDKIETIIALKKISKQFQGLDGVSPALWPTLPRNIIVLMIFSGCVGWIYSHFFNAMGRAPCAC
jgi:hypothetical protein